MKDKIIEKALKDAEFRKKLVKDPAAALAAHGVKLPAGFELKVVEDTAETVHLVLPPASSGSLSDKELSGVAGGYIDQGSHPCFQPGYQFPTQKTKQSNC